MLRFAELESPVSGWVLDSIVNTHPTNRTSFWEVSLIHQRRGKLVSSTDRSLVKAWHAAVRAAEIADAQENRYAAV